MLVLPLVACQGVAGASEPPQPRLAIDSALAANQAAAAARAASGAATNVTYMVQRGTITDSLTIPGRVVPAVASQVTIQRPGTVTAIEVHSGQAVKKGDPLVEVAVDDTVIQDLQIRATLADLEYKSQAAKVDDMKRGAGPEQLAAARAEVAKAQADVERAQVEQEIGQQQAQHDRQAADTVKDDHDRQIGLQELAVQTANDELDAAQTALKRVQGLFAHARADATAASQADAQTLAERIEAATRSAQKGTAETRAARRNVEASIAKLDEASAGINAAKVQQDIAAQENQVALTREALHDAQAVADDIDHALDPTGVIAANATMAVRNASRELGHQLDALQLLRAQLDPAKQADERAVRLAHIELDQAKDDLAQAQAAEQSANQDLQRLKATTLPPARLTGADLDLDLPAAEARIHAAQRKVEAEELRLEALRATVLDDSSAENQLKSKLATVEIQAAQAALEVARTKLVMLQQGPASGDIAREENRLAILEDASNDAHRAVQPTIVAAAPFDGTVAAVDVRLGQSVDARTVAARVAGEGGLSIVAQASESDVTQLSLNQKVGVGFPGLGENSAATGSIVDISGASAPSTTLSTTGDSKVTYPVTV
ncbi:MAG TPA: HlyD family efflux transporter periplasmic adaptor subunit, partial [Chloroflexota bacterium]|nr:HlyD family efflux transporter periplasmic adaptor subunit [Chloroflexota bacterium]